MSQDNQNPGLVSVVRYQKPRDSVAQAVELSRGLEGLKPGDRVFIKPNIVYWTRSVPLPKYGVITTTRVVEDVVILLKERGVERITIGEGTVTLKPNDPQTVDHAFLNLGYRELAKRYGVRVVDLWQRPFEKRDLGRGISLSFSTEALECDFLVNLPVLKTHAQTRVSLGLKNLKGVLDMASRKACHNARPGQDLHHLVARLAEHLPGGLTLIDGIYSLERGPGFDGRAHRSDLLVASTDPFSADKVGAVLLGHDPAGVDHLRVAAERRGRSLNLSDLTIAGEDPLALAKPHRHDFPYTEDGLLPLGLAKLGIKGLSYRHYDDTLCTYCSAVNGAVVTAIAKAWQNRPWDEVEILTGKIMDPDPAKKTILLGKCLCQAHQDHAEFERMIKVKSCPPQPKAVVRALHQAGIEVDPEIIANMDQTPALYLKRYQDKPGFEEGFYRVE